MSRVFDHNRARDVYESFSILYTLQAIVMWIFIIVAMYMAQWKSAYWAPSIVSSIAVILVGLLNIYLCRNALTFEKEEDTKKKYMKMMKILDILVVIMAIVCVIGLVMAGWLGFTYGEDEIANIDTVIHSDSTNSVDSEQLQKEKEDLENKKDGNGQIAGALLGLNFMGDMMAVFSFWASCKFRQYLRTQENLMTPSQYEAYVMETM